MAKHKPTVGIAFGSGGARGVAHIGVLRVLQAAGIPITALAGSSVGAWIAAHYGLYADIDHLTELTVGREREKLLAFLEPSLHGGLVKGDRLERLLREWLDDRQFDQARIPFAVVATDLDTGAPVVINTGPVVGAVHASMAVPGLFAPVVIKGKTLIDGGASRPVPDAVVRAMGVDIVISVNLDSYYRQPARGTKKLTARGVSYAGFSIMRANFSDQSMQSSDIIISPPLQTTGWLGFKKYFADHGGAEMMAIGEQAARAAMPQIKKLLKEYDR